MMKRPFGFQFTIGTGTVYQMICTAKSINWTRVTL